jgi:metal-dependent amidase/aminoacylase/carboxypeptidase family protein
VVNDVTLSENFARYMRMQPDVNVQRPAPTMGAEDFAYFAHAVPAVQVRLGVRNEAEGIVHSGHSPQFRIDEAALSTGVQTLVAFAAGVGSGEVAAGLSRNGEDLH